VSVSPKVVENTRFQDFGGFFHPSISNVFVPSVYGLLSLYFRKKSVPANRKKGFYTSRLLQIEDIGGIFVFSGSELQSFQKFEINT
jgi:hypothetical protein